MTKFYFYFLLKLLLSFYINFCERWGFITDFIIGIIRMWTLYSYFCIVGILIIIVIIGSIMYINTGIYNGAIEVLIWITVVYFHVIFIISIFLNDLFFITITIIPIFNWLLSIIIYIFMIIYIVVNLFYYILSFFTILLNNIPIFLVPKLIFWIIRLNLIFH